MRSVASSRAGGRDHEARSVGIEDERSAGVRQTACRKRCRREADIATTSGSSAMYQRRARRRRSAFAITDTELNVIAALAQMGLMRIDRNG